MKKIQEKTIPLGMVVDHKETYHPEHLFPVPRKEARLGLGIGTALPFTGVDTWNAYELSWLDARGKPRVALGELVFPCSSENIVETRTFGGRVESRPINSPSPPAQNAGRYLTRCPGSKTCPKIPSNL